MAIKEIKRIRQTDIFKVFLRSFFLQSVWNYRSLLSVGFESCLLPIVKRLYPDVQPRREFLERHLKFFNAHPYLASYALGVSIRLEEGIATGSTKVSDQLDRIKDLLIPTLGAKGDQLFWLTIRPYSLIIGLLGLFIFDSVAKKIAVLALTFLVYNIPHLYIRYIGLIEGYKSGLDVYKCLNKDRFRKLEQTYLYLGVTAFLLLILGAIVSYFPENKANILFLVGAVVYSWLIYKISSNFYFTIIFTILFFMIVGFIFL